MGSHPGRVRIGWQDSAAHRISFGTHDVRQPLGCQCPENPGKDRFAVPAEQSALVARPVGSCARLACFPSSRDRCGDLPLAVARSDVGHTAPERAPRPGGFGRAGSPGRPSSGIGRPTAAVGRRVRGMLPMTSRSPEEAGRTSPHLRRRSSPRERLVSGHDRAGSHGGEPPPTRLVVGDRVVRIDSFRSATTPSWSPRAIRTTSPSSWSRLTRRPRRHAPRWPKRYAPTTSPRPHRSASTPGRERGQPSRSTERSGAGAGAGGGMSAVSKPPEMICVANSDRRR